MKIAVDGVEMFKEENCDLIIVDTVGATNKKQLFLKKCDKFLKQRYVLLCSIFFPFIRCSSFCFPQKLDLVLLL